MDILKKCIECGGEEIKEIGTYNSKNHGELKIFKCEECGYKFSDTKDTIMEGLKTPYSEISRGLEARTEGLALNAAVRVFI